jgi:chitinase
MSSARIPSAPSRAALTRLAAFAALAALPLACSSTSGSAASGDAGNTTGGEGGTPDAGSAVDSPSGDATGTTGDSGSPGDGGGTKPQDGGSATDGGGSGDSGGTSPTTWVMGYYSSWDDPANGGPYAVSSIDWNGLTHVATAFYVPDGNGGWMSGAFDAGTASSLISAAHANGKKVLASIGGADSGPGFEGSTQNAMSTFLSSLRALVTMGYDGLDIDWEGGNLTTAQDQMLQGSLTDAILAQSPGIILTMTAGYENENLLDDLSWYGTMAAKVDRIELMTYGMSGAYQGWESWHSSPLHWNSNSSTPTGIDATVSHYIAAGVPAAKLSVGSGFYGECYTSPVTAPVQMLGASTIPASDGTMSYANIMSSYYSQSAYEYDNGAQVPYLTLSGQNAEGCTYVTYEDATSIAAKGAWVKSQGLGGVIIWTISEGYVASGSGVAGQNPLLEAMKTALLQ